MFALDVETTLVEKGKQPSLLGGCLYDGHEMQKLKPAQLLPQVRALCNRDEKFLIHNAVFDREVLAHHGVHIPYTQIIDTMVLAHAVNPQRHPRGKLSPHSLAWWGELLGFPKSEQPASFGICWDSALADYCAIDTELLWKVGTVLLPHLQGDEKLSVSFSDILMPFVGVVASLNGGMYVDEMKLLTLGIQLAEDIEVARHKFLQDYPYVWKLKFPREGGWVLTETKVCPNIDSPNDVLSLLLMYGWKPTEFSEAGRPETKQALLKMDMLTAEPELKQLLSDLVELRAMVGINKQVHTLLEAQQRGWIYPYWSQVGTVTGRMSCSGPNLQNISTRHPVWGEKIRCCFVPPAGYDMVVGDLSQIELAILAYYLEAVVGDSYMARAAREGADFHARNAEAWYHVAPEDEGFSAARKRSKNGIFATNYGAGVRKLSTTLGISIVEATEIMQKVEQNLYITELKRKLWGKMREVRDIKPVVHYAQEYYSCMFYDIMGVRHFYPHLSSPRKADRASAERQSFNCIMQGGQSSLFYHLCARVLPAIADAGGWFAGLVHDEAILYVPREHTAALLPLLNDNFQYLLPTPQGGVPVHADFKAVTNWSEK